MAELQRLWEPRPRGEWHEQRAYGVAATIDSPRGRGSHKAVVFSQPRHFSPGTTIIEKYGEAMGSTSSNATMRWLAMVARST